MTPRERFAERRGAAHQRLDGASMVLQAAPQLTTGRDTDVRYIPDAELYYLTGSTEPGTLAVLTSHQDGPFVLFIRPRDEEAERWTGPREDPEAAAERYRADTVYTLDQLDEKLPPLLADAPRLLLRFDNLHGPALRAIETTLRSARSSKQRSGKGPDTLVDPGSVLDEMRIIKDEDEIRAIRDAVRITVQAFPEALDRAEPGRGEWEVEAAMEAGFRRRGADGYAFPTIAASGANAAVLHYTANRRVMQNGDLLLVDAGARLDQYNADITRTVPIGRQDGPATDILAAVDQARRAAIQAVEPGASINDVHDAARRVLAAAILDLGLSDHTLDELMDDEEKTRPYFPHKTSHWLGLDVHDVGAYVIHDTPRILEPGMVLTVEPGLYIPDDDRAPEHLRGIGARLEDDLLVTPDGHEILSADLP